MNRNIYMQDALTILFCLEWQLSLHKIRSLTKMYSTMSLNSETPKHFPCLNPFLFIKNKQLFISSEGFSALEKPILRRPCCPSNRAWQPSADSNGCLAHFLKIWTWCVGCDSLLQIVMAVWLASNLKKVHPMAITICRGLSHPTRSLSRIVCRGQEGPKGSKGTLRPDFQ
jgi:hypothetical protein